MTKIAAGFLTGLLVALGVPAVASSQAPGHCSTWQNGTTVQCNVYFPGDATHVRVKAYVGGVHTFSTDFWPQLWTEAQVQMGGQE
jgi:hypothetical protein